MRNFFGYYIVICAREESLGTKMWMTM